MTHLITKYEQIFDILPCASHDDRCHVVGNDGTVVEAYRFEQVWGTNSLAVLLTGSDRKKRFNSWIEKIGSQKADEQVGHLA